MKARKWQESRNWIGGLFGMRGKKILSRHGSFVEKLASIAAICKTKFAMKAGDCFASRQSTICESISRFWSGLIMHDEILNELKTCRND